jgi:coenzyme F420 hydrogenase subunit beta
MSATITGIRDVAEKQLCTGCGACAYIAPDKIKMVDTLKEGRRPLVNDESVGELDPLAACPGIGLEHTFDTKQDGLVRELLPGWGPVLELWEGYAGDNALRLAGSSGGAATALALHGIEHGGFHGTLHIAAREDVPYLNKTVLSRSREEMMAATGSRYAPASPCDRLDLIENAPTPCTFIGKPCDVAAVDKARRLKPRLDEKVGLTIAIFCAGTPSTAGTLEMIRQMGIDSPTSVSDVRYRGNGWPGMARVTGTSEGAEVTRELSYADSWGAILEKHRQWRCYVCADHTGEFADISVGDPWYREIPEGEPGRSLVIVRTDRGRRFLKAAMESGALTLERVEPHVLPASQSGLLGVRGSVWARTRVLRLFGAAAPKYVGLPMFHAWLSELTLKAKLRSIVGTMKRIYRKGLKVRRKVVPFEPPT